MRWLIGLVIISILFSCEKGIEFDLDARPDVIVVDASIENNAQPIVVLTKSLAYFSQITPQILANSFIHNAQVYISDGTKTQQLKEYVLDNNAAYKIYYYTIDSSNLATVFLGKLNTSYTLKIVNEGKEYNAKTSIPGLRKSIDSLWWERGLFKDTTRVEMMVKITDQKGFGDYIRYFTKRNGEPFLPAETSAFDDLFIDGTTYEVPVEPGRDRNSQNPYDSIYFKKGDTVTFKLSGIDKQTFDFWRTLEYSYQAVGNPFSSPIKVLGNISNGALGYFGGYASQMRTLIIPK